MDKEKERREGSTCGKATKDVAGKKAGMPCKGKSAEKQKEAKESRRK